MSSKKNSKNTAFVMTLEQVRKEAAQREAAKEASRLTWLESRSGKVTRFFCPFSIEGCTSERTHEEHYTFEKALALPRMTMSTVYAVLGHILREGVFRDQSVKAFRLILAHPDCSLRAREIMVYHAATNTILSTYHYKRLEMGPENPIEFLLGIPDLSTSELKRLVGSSAATPESVLALLEQKNYHDLLGVTFFLNNRDVKVSSYSENHGVDFRAAFSFASPSVRVAVAIAHLDPKLDARKLLAAAKRILNDLNRDRAGALELIEVMAKEWYGTLDEFHVMVKALV